jgi:hypothetical protein
MLDSNQAFREMISNLLHDIRADNRSGRKSLTDANKKNMQDINVILAQIVNEIKEVASANKVEL